MKRSKLIGNQKKTPIMASIVMTFFSACAVLPFLLMLASSVSEENRIVSQGYSILPRGFSLDAYRYILANFGVIGRAYFVTVLVTIAGTALGLAITALAGYVVAQENLPGGKVLMFLVVFIMLFNGGLIPTYYIYTQVLQLKNNILALILPNLLLNPFNVILARNYFKNSIPHTIIEAAEVDGASVFRTFFVIVLPLSKPILATMGLMIAIAYWNDWQNGLYYISRTNLYSIQQVLRTMSTQISSLGNIGGSTGVVAAIPTQTTRMAIATVSVLPILIAYPFFQQYFVKGITMGAVKE